MNNSESTSATEAITNIDARGEQEAHNGEDLGALSTAAAPGGSSYDPELWNHLAAGSGALS